MKPWYQSKTKWAAILIASIPILSLFPAAAPAIPVIEAIATVLGGFALKNFSAALTKE